MDDARPWTTKAKAIALALDFLNEVSALWLTFPWL